MPDDFYTAELSKGKGVIAETVTLLKVWRPGMTKAQLGEVAMTSGILGRATERRTLDIVDRCFASRFLVDGDTPTAWLNRLVQRGLGGQELAQIFFIYAARANLILHDFVTQVYWGNYAAGMNCVGGDDSHAFLDRAMNEGRMVTRWSESTRIRIGRYLLGTLEDFGLLGPLRSGRRDILPFDTTTLTALYLAHELHFRAYSDNGIVAHRDWHLFGLERHDVVRRLDRTSREGHVIVQDSGELTRITWKHATMEGFLDAVSG